MEDVAQQEESQGMTFEEFFKKHPITMTCEAGGVPPEDFKDSDPWVCTLTWDEGKGVTARKGTLKMPFYTGKGHRKFDKRLWMRNHPGYGVPTQQDEYKAQMRGDYSCFRLTQPDISTVLDCLVSDSSGYDNSRCFEDWAGDYGYDTDSRKAETLYQQIREQRNRLENFLGREAYQDLLYKVERL